LRSGPTHAGQPKEVRLDELDEQILWALVKDARTPNNALAEQLGVSPSTTLTRMRALREAGILRSSHAEIDATAVGLHIQALVFVRLRPQARPEIKSYSQRVILLPNVLDIYFLGGEDDFLIHVACTSTDQLRGFVATKLSMDPAVASTRTQIVFEHLIGAQHRAHVNSFDELRASIS
jgi:DNA-binding Lrp family transcriptional regulator